MSDVTHVASVGNEYGIPDEIGQYRLLGIIGRGGMGSVFEAEQQHPKRTVAFKVINPGIASPKMLRRFELEAEVLARLQHPGIAQVYEAGTFDAGAGAQPYFAMELIKGEPLTRHVNRKKLDIRQRLELVIKICDAVHHAHHRGIIHRDLKPDNILVNERNEPKILDFGVARAINADIQVTTLTTVIGQLIGTVPYMSPEQAAGDPNELDIRSDVYALGVITYELLTDRLPYDVRDKLIHEAVRVIREDEPAPLSSINRTFRGDLDTILTKALEKEKSRRYESAAALADDLRRYLNDEPIAARPPSTWYQIKKFSKRNKALVTGVAAAIIMLTIGIIGTSTFAIRESLARGEANQRAQELEQVAEFQAEQLSGINVPVMGVRFREDLLTRKREALINAGRNEKEIENGVTQLEASLAGINFTDAALETLDENILVRALQAIESQFGDQPLVKARLLQTVANTHSDLGLFDAAVAPQEEALMVRRRVLGDEHPDTLGSMNNMGLLLQRQGKLTEAESSHHEALAKHRQVLGDVHPATLTLINNIGLLLQAQGKLSEAESYYRDALETRRLILGDKHPDTLISINCMGFLFEAQGKLDEAEPYYREALEKTRQVLGDEHPDTLISINNMGSLLQAQGKLDEAESYYREALEKSRRILGNDHLDTLTSINNMGNLLQTQGKLNEAEHFLRESLEKRRRVLGDEHPNTLTSINSVGYLLARMGKLAEAEPYFYEVLETRRRVLGDEHPDMLVSINNMAGLLMTQGKVAEAEPYFRKGLEAMRRVLGDEHPNTLISINNMGGLLMTQDKPAEAEPYFREALDTRRRVLGDTHPDTLQSIRNMGRLLREQSRFNEAEALLLPAVALAEAKLPATHPIRQNLPTVISNLYESWDAAEPGKGYDKKAAEWQDKLAELQQDDETIQARAEETEEAK